MKEVCAVFYNRLNNGEIVTEVLHGLDFARTADIIVAGLGCAGAIAAITAAEEGADVLGIEEQPGMGGLGVYGGVWHYFYGSSGGRFEASNAESDRMMNEEAYTRAEPKRDGDHYRCYNGTTKGLALEREAADAGLEAWFCTPITGVFYEMDGDTRNVVGIECLHNGKRTCVRAKYVIDATGASLITRLLGLPLHSGRERDGRQMLISKVTTVYRNGEVVGIYSMCGFRENLDCASYSRMLLDAQTKSPCDMRTSDENDRMVLEPVEPGVREAARIEAEENVTFVDYLAGKRTDKPLMYAFAPVDNATLDMYNEDDAMLDWMLGCGFMYSYGISVGLPLGALLPRHTEGLLTAGKGIGVDHDLSTCIRMRKDMEKLGEAAAVAAVCAVRAGCDLRSVPYDDICAMLTKTGCLDEKNDEGLCRVWGGMQRAPETIPTDPDTLHDVLSSNNPGTAIYALWQMPEKCGSEGLLREWLCSEYDSLRYHAAMAAGLLGMPECLPVLRSLASMPPFDLPSGYPYSCLKTRAVYLLGRMHDRDALPILRYVANEEKFPEILEKIPCFAALAIERIEKEN